MVPFGRLKVGCVVEVVVTGGVDSVVVVEVE